MSAPALKVLLKSPFSLYSGYGHDGFELLRALDRWGADVYPQPVWMDVPIPPDLLPLFAKTLAGPFDLTINHWDPANLHITREAREMTRLAVAWTMWEFTSLDPHCGNLRSVTEEDLLTWRRVWELGWQAEGAPAAPVRLPAREGEGLADRLRWFDAVLGYSDVSLQALEPWIPEKVHRGVLQGGFEAADWKPAERDWHSPRFLFGMHGALNNRKAPYTVLQAFLELKDENPGPWPEGFDDARLALHTTCPPLFPEMNRIYSGKGVRVYMEAWDTRTLHKFYEACHALVYPSHGEGKNLPALEFAATGGVVLATNWSGHTGWLRSDLAYPLDYELAAVSARDPLGAQWAVVPLAEVKRAMWHVYASRAEARAKGELASRVIPQMCSWDTVLESLFRRLRDLVPGQGQTVYDLAMACRRDQGEEPDVS